MKQKSYLIIIVISFFLSITGLVPVWASDEQSALSKPGTEAGEERSIDIKGIRYTFRWCPPGKFLMGSPESEEGRDSKETQHEVTLSKGFWMLETEVTQGMWKSVMGSTIRELTEKKLQYTYEIGEGAKYPMSSVSWNDCEEFIKRLNSSDTPVSGFRFSLPTKAQWEYACRAGTTGKYGGTGNLEDMGWFKGSASRKEYVLFVGVKEIKMHKVKEKKPNAWGLYDMHGNVSEWCNDWDGVYPKGSVTDPIGPESGSFRVFRGGSWKTDEKYCRSASRRAGLQTDRDSSLGFRIVLSSTEIKEADSAPPQFNYSAAAPATSTSISAGSLTEPGTEVASEGKYIDIKGIRYTFRWCPAGTFMMGAVESKSGFDMPQHEVTLSKGFWMLDTEVTQAMWESVMGTTIQEQTNKGPRRRSKDKSKELVGVGPEYPMYCVNWHEAAEFCKKLSELARIKVSLPTEAQWEYACRAGTTGKYGGTGNLEGMGWFKSNGNDRTHRVKRMQPNAWGLYDMHGNVGEWCNDWYDDYPSGSVTDPTGPEINWAAVVRGGSWSSNEDSCRSADRDCVFWEKRSNSNGFRIVLSTTEIKRADTTSPPSGSSSSTVTESEDTSTSAGSLSEPGTEAGEGRYIDIKEIRYTFRWCPPGKFMMGRAENQLKVTLTKGFWMLDTEVTQAMWKSIMGNNPSHFRGDISEDSGINTDNFPVESVSWNDYQEFCKKLSEHVGIKASLPTEAQWEYASRAGTTGEYGGTGSLDNMGWFKSNSNNRTHEVKGKQHNRIDDSIGILFGKNRTHEVKGKKPNAWGLYDMFGNVSELCSDYYGNLPIGNVTDPTGPVRDDLPPELRSRLYRGGSISTDENELQGCRDMEIHLEICDRGFRIVISPPPDK